MLKDYSLLNLHEAKNKLEEIIEALEECNQYDSATFRVDIQHLYAHINAAWNGRNFNVQKDELTAEKFINYITFPEDVFI